MLMRTPLAPAAINCSTISGSREAGPRVIIIFARLKVQTCLDELRNGGLQCVFDRSVENFTRFGGVADEASHELASPIENERLGNCIAVRKQQAYEIFVGL